MLTLTEKDINELNDFLQDMPLKHGLPLFNFFNSKIAEQKRQQTTVQEVPVVEEPVTE